MLDSCGNSGKVETPQGESPRRLNSRPAESEHLERKSTTTFFFKTATNFKKRTFCKHRLSTGQKCDKLEGVFIKRSMIKNETFWNRY